MTTLELQVLRWKLVALLAAALLVGYIVGQFAPSAHAQLGATRFQIDTSNCTVGSTTSRGLVPAGVIVTAHDGSRWFHVRCRY
jgi:cytochrome oxidase Cu insertion factor (SCO1/SenC/PrrC family)